MRRKVIKVGDSKAVTLPKQEAEELGLKEGDTLYVSIDHERKEITYSKEKLKKKAPLTKREKELMRFADNFIKHYKKDLEALAKK